MFLVFNKEKICAYIVSVLTVCALFFIASSTEKSIETSTNVNIEIVRNIEENKTIQNNIEK